MRNELHEIANRLRIDLDQLKNVAVLVLPENIAKAGPDDELLDAEGSVYLTKKLKQEGVACKNAFDLGLRPSVLERRGMETWLGVLWLFVEHGLFPTASGVISTYLSSMFSGDDRRSSTHVPPKVHVELKIQRNDTVGTISVDGSPAEVVAVIDGLAKLYGERCERPDSIDG